MLNGVSFEERQDRVTEGVLAQIDDFRWIIRDYIQSLGEQELRDFYELQEDLDAVDEE